MVSEKSSQQHINDKEAQFNKATKDSGSTVCVAVSIERLDLRAKNYAKQEKVFMVADDCGETAASCRVGLEPYVNLLARICEDGLAEAESSGKEMFVS